MPVPTGGAPGNPKKEDPVRKSIMVLLLLKTATHLPVQENHSIALSCRPACYGHYKRVMQDLSPQDAYGSSPAAGYWKTAERFPGPFPHDLSGPRQVTRAENGFMALKSVPQEPGIPAPLVYRNTIPRGRERPAPGPFFHPTAKGRSPGLDARGRYPEKKTVMAE